MLPLFIPSIPPLIELPSMITPHSVGWNLGLGYARFPSSPSTLTSSVESSDPFPVHSQLRFRALRRFFHTSIGPRASLSSDLVSLQEKERTRLLSRLIGFGEKGGVKGGDVSDIIRQ